MIIGLVGCKNSGKSTVANYLVQKYGFQEISFASVLKKVVLDIFDLHPDQVYTQHGKETVDKNLNVSPRQLLQVVGTDLFRISLKRYLPDININYDSIWISKVHKQICQILTHNPYANIVVSDVRFQNEADMIKDLNGVLFRISRHDSQLNYDNHSSETEMLGIPTDETIQNDATLLKLFLKIDKIIPLKAKISDLFLKMDEIIPLE